MGKFSELDMDKFFEDNKDLMEDLANQEEKDKLRSKLDELKVFHAELGLLIVELEYEIKS